MNYTDIQLDNAVREMLVCVGAGATRFSEDDIAMGRAILKKHLAGGDGVREIDLDQNDWRAIKEAAMKSPWIPPEYMKNDWVNDIIKFLGGEMNPVLLNTLRETAAVLGGMAEGHQINAIMGTDDAEQKAWNEGQLKRYARMRDAVLAIIDNFPRLP